MREYDATSWSELLCPYCRTCNSREPEDMPWRDGEDIEIECRNCDKEFIVEAWTTTNWTTKEKEDDYDEDQPNAAE